MKMVFEKAYFTQLGYTYNTALKELIEYMKLFRAKTSANAISICGIFDMFDIDESLMASLVLMFGDYDNNPQHGWIDDIDGCIAYLESVQKYWEDTEDD